MSDKKDTLVPKKVLEQPPLGVERNVSVDSSTFYEGDEYDDLDDFGAQGMRSGGAGASGGAGTKKTDKRQEKRGGSGGSGTIYSTKHIRAKESQPRTKK
jgi:hypothetical protein